MKIQELREKSVNELQTLLNQERVKVGELRFKLASKQLKNVREIRQARKNIARILTLINLKQKISNQKNEQ